MRRKLNRLALLLVLTAGPAGAAWKSVAQDEATTAYADPASVVRSGGTATMASLVDYKAFQRMVEVGYHSRRDHAEYDCSGRQVRGLGIALHEGQMGAGKVIYEDTSTHDWEPVLPDTLNEYLWKLACN